MYGDRYTTRRKFMKGLCKRAGVRPFGLHALRRFFASLLVDKYKESIPVIQKLLGHASPSTTDRYIFNISQDAQRAVEKINFEIKIPEKIPEKGKGSQK
jgi:integrase